jgi:hypothetical protein
MTATKRTEVYRENTIENLKMFLDKKNQEGKSKHYCIYVDGNPIVSLTNNPSEVYSAKRYIFPGTSAMVVIYCHHETKEPYEEITYEVPKPVNAGNGLSGIEIKEQINSAIQAERQKWEHEQLKDELKDTKEELKEAEEYIDQMEKLVEELKGNKGKIGNVHVGEVVSVMVESFMRRNIDKVKKLPGGAALAGLLSDNPNTGSEPTEETEATFEKVKDEPSWWDDIKTVFTEEEVQIIQAIVAHFAQRKDQIKAVFEFLMKNQ